MNFQIFDENFQNWIQLTSEVFQYALEVSSGRQVFFFFIIDKTKKFIKIYFFSDDFLG